MKVGVTHIYVSIEDINNTETTVGWHESPQQEGCTSFPATINVVCKPGKSKWIELIENSKLHACSYNGEEFVDIETGKTIDLIPIKIND